MEGSEIWISFRRVWISIPPDFDFVPTGFDFLPTDFELPPPVFEVGKGRGVDPLRRCGVADNVEVGATLWLWKTFPSAANS